MQTRQMRVQDWLTRLTGKWWFYLALFLLTFIPAYTSKPYGSDESAGLVIAVLSNAVIYSWKALFPVFKIAPIMIFAALAIWKNRAARAFHLYAALNFLVVGLFENMAFTRGYGFAVLIGNAAISMIIAASWFWEGVVRQSDLGRAKLTADRLWVLPLAALAFWYPINMSTLAPDFKLHYLITSEAGVTFCMMLPVYLAVMLLFLPNVNVVTLRVTSFAGVVIGFLSAVQFFALNQGMGWMGMLHLPLLIISIYAFVLSIRMKDISAMGESPAAGRDPKDLDATG